MIILWSRLLAEPHQTLIGTIPVDPSDDAKWRGGISESSEPGKIQVTDPKSHTPPRTILTAFMGARHYANSMVDPNYSLAWEEK